MVTVQRVLCLWLSVNGTFEHAEIIPKQANMVSCATCAAFGFPCAVPKGRMELMVGRNMKNMGYYKTW